MGKTAYNSHSPLHADAREMASDPMLISARLKLRRFLMALFGGGVNTDNMPTTALTAEDFTDGTVSLIDIMLKAGIIKSRGEGRRLIEQGGVTVDDEKAKSFTDTVSENAFEKGYVIVKKGKKVFNKFIIE